MRAMVLGLLLTGLCRPVAANLYRYPLAGDKGTVTAYFDHSGQDWNCGTKRYTGHKGSDFGVAKGTPIYAGAGGTVVYINDGCTDTCTTGSCGCGGGFGNYVKLQHADGKFTYYAHMEIWSVKVAVNQQVSCGQQLGNVASSGNSTGNHLHFEVRISTTSQDPYSGSCSTPTSLWVGQGPYLGRPSTQCTSPPPPDLGPKPDTRPPKPDAAPVTPDLKPLDAIGTETHVPGPDGSGGEGNMPPIWPSTPGGTVLHGGCSVGGDSASSWPWLVVLLLGLARRRSR